MGSASEVTGAELVARARNRCDQVESDFRSTGDWFKLISAAWAKVYARIIVNGGDHFLTSRTVTTSSGDDTYDLPFDCWKLKGVDYEISSDDSRTLDLFSWDRRNRYKVASTWNFDTPIAYRMRGQSIVFQPRPQGVYTVRLWFFPTPQKLSGPNDTIDGISGLEEAVVCIAARMAAQEQGDTELASQLAAQEALELQRVDEESQSRDAGGIEYAVDVHDRLEDEWPGRWLR